MDCTHHSLVLHPKTIIYVNAVQNNLNALKPIIMFNIFLSILSASVTNQLCTNNVCMHVLTRTAKGFSVWKISYPNQIINWKNIEFIPKTFDQLVMMVGNEVIVSWLMIEWKRQLNKIEFLSKIIVCPHSQWTNKWFHPNFCWWYWRVDPLVRECVSVFDMWCICIWFKWHGK